MAPQKWRSPKRYEHRYSCRLSDHLLKAQTSTAGASANRYYESAHDPSAFGPKERSPVPTGVAVFTSQDVAIRRFAEPDNTIVHWSEFDRGGHFPAMEVPDLLVGDVREFFRGLR